MSRAATLSDIEPRFMCSACGKRGADVRPDFNWKKMPVKAMGFRQSSSDGSQSTTMRVAHERGAGAPPSGWSKTDDTVFAKRTQFLFEKSVPCSFLAARAVAGSSSSMRTVVDQACAFARHRSRSGESRLATFFAKRTQFLSVAIEAALTDTLRSASVAFVDENGGGRRRQTEKTRF